MTIPGDLSTGSLMVFVIATCQTMTVKQNRFCNWIIRQKWRREPCWHILECWSGFPNLSCKHFRSMLIFFPTQHFIRGCFQSFTTDNLHAPIFLACEATHWQSSLAAAQLLLWNSLASPWLRCRTLSPDLSGPGSPQTHVSPLAPCMRDSWCKSLSALVKKKTI